MGLDRRSFISFLAGGAAGILCTPVVWKSIDDISIWSQNWPWIPRLRYGAREKAPSLCKLGNDVYGISVLKVAGNPVSAHGNTEHFLSQGGLDGMGAASVQMLYSPARVRTPLKRENGQFVQISWDEAKKILTEKLRLAGENVSLISGDETGSSTEVLAAFVASLGSEDIFLMPSEWAPANRAWNDFFGCKGQIGYDLEHADCILALGADIFSSWGTTIRNARLLVEKDENTQYIYAGPVQNNTAASCDFWLPCLPGRAGILALGIAWYLLKENLFDQSLSMTGFTEYRKHVYSRFQPQQVAAATGVEQKDIARVAKMLAEAKHPLVLPGTESGMGMNPYDFAAIMSLNILLGQVNVQGGVQNLPEMDNLLEKAPTRAKIRANDLLSFLFSQNASGGEDNRVTLVYEANPLYALPDGKRVASALKSSFLVSFSPFMDETASEADLILPNSYFLERLDDAYTPYGSGQINYSVAEAVIKPLFETRATPDFIFELADEMGLALGFSSFEEMLQARATSLGADWESLLAGSAWKDEKVLPQAVFNLWKGEEGLWAGSESGKKKLALAVSWPDNVGNAKMAMTPFSLLTIPDNQLLGKDLFVHVNSITASEMRLMEGQSVYLGNSSGEKCKVRVHISEEVMPGVVWAPLGFGHTAWDEYSRGKGENLFRVLGVDSDLSLGLSVCSMPDILLEKTS